VACLPLRSRSKSPAGFVIPAHPTQVAKPPAGPDWIREVKHDGYRLLDRKNAGRVVLWTRHGTNFTDRLRKIAEAVRSLRVEIVEYRRPRSIGGSRYCVRHEWWATRHEVAALQPLRGG
jgi:hypothetical protein